MKKSVLLISIITVLVMVLQSCEEDEYKDWDIQNKIWYSQYKQTNQNDSNFYTTESGISYRVIHQGWKFAPTPKLTDKIIVTYELKLTNGDLVSKVTDEELQLSSTISGWKEILPKMNVGSNYIIYIPSSLAYADKGSSGIPPHSVLIFDVTLKDIY